MREAYFRKIREPHWDRIEGLGNQDSDEIANSFMEVSQDLSFVKTYFPKSELNGYLNGIAIKFYSAIYKNKKEKKGAFKKYWVRDLPLVIHKIRWELLYSFLFFGLCVMIGGIAAAKNPNFIRLILGEGYINMTNENINKGDPFGVYKSMDSLSMFLGIMVNNIYVSFTIFVNGIFFCAGTLWALFQNGIMLGSFQYYFFSKGLGWASILVIWIHGTIEISSIIIAGATGLRLGKGFLFPGNYSRLESVKQAALEGIKILIGLVPFFVVAAFLEGFVTRHDHMPKWLSISILLLSIILIIFYFFIYPKKVYQSEKIKIQTS